MQNRNKPFVPQAGQSFNLVSIQRTKLREETPKKEAQQEAQRRGKLNYLGGPVKEKKKERRETREEKPARPAVRVEERKTLSIGRFFGDGEKLTAFVMLDPEDLGTP